MAKGAKLPEDVAKEFSVLPKTPGKFATRYGEYDLSELTLRQANFLADRGIAVRRIKKPPKPED